MEYKPLDASNLFDPNLVLEIAKYAGCCTEKLVVLAKWLAPSRTLETLFTIAPWGHIYEYTELSLNYIPFAKIDNSLSRKSEELLEAISYSQIEELYLEPNFPKSIYKYEFPNVKKLHLYNKKIGKLLTLFPNLTSLGIHIDQCFLPETTSFSQLLSYNGPLIRGVEHMINLTSLTLSYDHKESLSVDLSKLKKLEELRMFTTNLHIFKTLDVRNIITLSVTNDYLTEEKSALYLKEALKSMTSLRSLTLNYYCMPLLLENVNSDILHLTIACPWNFDIKLYKLLNQFKKLLILSITSVGYSIHGIELPNLRKLILNNCCLYNVNLQKLPKLKTFIIGRTDLKIDIDCYVSSSVKRISLNGFRNYNLSEELETLFKNMPNIEEMNIDVSSRGVVKIPGFKYYPHSYYNYKKIT